MREDIEGSAGFALAFRRQRRVVFALMLRGMRTRFFGHGLGYLIAIGWPLAHILIVVAMFGWGGRAAPIGDDAVLFIATGAAPFQIFSYLSGFMTFSIISARPLFSLPEVKVLDGLFAAAALETLSSIMVTALLVLVGLALDIKIAPRSMEEAACAYGSALLLGVGFGLFNGVLALALPMWPTVFALVRILLWIASGVAFLPDNLPEPYRTALSYNPMAQSVEWMRVAYYEGVGAGFLDKAYVIKFGVCAVFVGLLAERVSRGHLLAQR